MVSLDVVGNSNSELAKSQPLVAVCVGGTAGIGESTVRTIAKTYAANQGKELRLYIVGRNKNAAQKIIEECIQTYSTGDFRFVQADDLGLLKNVDKVCDEIIRQEKEATGAGSDPRIDFLVLSQGTFFFSGREETTEGLERLMALIYYSRLCFVMNLLPLLLESQLPAHVVTVASPGREGKIDGSDLDLRKNYGIMASVSHFCYMMTFFMEKLSQKYAGKLSFIHYYPGLVMTDILEKAQVPTWLKWTWRYAVGPLSRPFAVSKDECGQRVLFLASKRFPARDTKSTGAETENGIEIATSTDGTVGGGSYNVNWNGEIVPLSKGYPKAREDGVPQLAWDHTMKVFEVISAGKKFED